MRIQDPQEGSEAYTFDLEWRGEGAGSTSQRFPGRDGGASPNSAVRACQDAVRERARQQYGLHNIAFRNPDADAGPGRNDVIVGSFNVSRGDYRGQLGQR